MADELLTREGLPQFLSEYNFDDVYRVPLMDKAPTIDGFVDEDEWRTAVGFDGMGHEAKLDERRARAYIGATKTHIYFAIVSEVPPEGSIETSVTQHTTSIIWDDCMEVWVNPNPEADTGITYQMLVNSIGCDAYQCHVVGNVPQEEWYGWQGNYRIANGFHDGYWHCEVEVPVEAFGKKDRKATDGKWSLNICRNWKQPWAFANLGNRSYNPTNDIRFEFVEDGAAAIQVKHLSDPTTRKIDTVLSMYNPGTKPLELEAHLFLKRDLMPEWQSDDDFVVPPGETRELKLKLDEAVAFKFALFAVVREKDGPFVYTRHYAWGKPREIRWETTPRVVLPLDFKFAHYPSYNKMRLLADISGLSDDAKLESVDFTIRKKGENDAVAFFRIAAADFGGQKVHEVTVDVPALDGVYEIAAGANGEGTPEEPVVKIVERYKYEWEGLGLGKSRKVYAPFTPIRVEGNTLHTVMKEYDLNGLGLLDQVRTLDQQRIALKDVLAGPMVYRAKVGGADVKIDAADVKIVSAEDDILVAESTAKLGAIELSTKSTLEYDGLLRVDLTVSSGSGAEVESLDLEIPFRGEVADMMHAMSDGVRYPIVTQRVPNGQGVIWSAADLLNCDWPKNFCTYIFIGDPRRGLCWFAENDRGWSWDHEKPNLELVRGEDGTVTMVVHLVNKPVKLDGPRTITFGLQGAPIKPKMEGWRHKWYTDNYSILGCDRHWFALGICGSVYPAGRDMHLWEMIKRGNTERLSKKEVDDFVEYGRKYFEPYGWETHTEEFVLLAPKTLTNRFGTTMVFYYDRSSSPVYDEWHTFADEWGMDDFNYRAGRLPWEIKIVPSESYIDYALYWYGKSFEVAGNTGVYVDNNYFCSCRNTAMTDAYEESDGSIMPSTGIWGLRELAKRTFIYMNELGMLPINMNHMSTTQILPINAFYTVQYDWEWKFSEGDTQDRFSREYLLEVTNGEHAGVWPIVLHDNGKRRMEPWNMRTFHGVCAVNELITDRYFWHEEPVPEGDHEENRLYYKLRVPISEMTRKPECVVYRYWDDRPQPVVTDKPNVPTVVYSLPGKEAIVSICSYSDKDEDVVLSIDAEALGLAGGYTAVDMEAGEPVAVVDNTIGFPLKKHDLKQFRLVGSC